MIYNVNQNRQFYVINEVVDPGDDKPTKVGQVQLVTDGINQLCFNHFGKGGLTRTDLIDIDKVCYAKLTKRAAMARHLKQAVVTLNEDVNEGKPIPGQDYILRIQVRNYLSPSDASVLIRSGAVHATKDMTAEKFYTKMADSLTKNFSRDPQPLLKFEADTDGIKIMEVGDQPWRLGVLSQDAVNFEVIATTVTYDGDEVVWMTTDDNGFVEITDADETVGNGKQIADLEYFCQAERGDMFRNMGWPNNIDVKYMVDPSKDYDVLDLHYYYSGDGVQVHKSEKDITFVAEDASVMEDLKTELVNNGISVKVETGKNSNRP